MSNASFLRILNSKAEGNTIPIAITLVYFNIQTNIVQNKKEHTIIACSFLFLQIDKPSLFTDLHEGFIGDL